MIDIRVTEYNKPKMLYKTGYSAILCPQRGRREALMHAVWSLLDCHVPNIAFPSPLWAAPIKEIGDPPKVESRMRHDSGTARVYREPAEDEGCPSTPGNKSLTLL